MKPTQPKRVTTKLLRDGYITRNEALGTFPCISRLSGIIQKLEEKGWEFSTEDTGKDYIYRVVKSPFKKVVRTLSDGRQLVNYEAGKR